MLIHNKTAAHSPNVTRQATRFGWSKQSPPANYTLPLSRDDYDQRHQPTASFIQKVAPFLMRNGNLDLPGFLLIPNLEQHIPQQDMNTFLEKAMIRLKQHLAQNYGPLFNPQHIPLTIIKKRQEDGKIGPEGNLHNEETQGKWTLKSPHFDRTAFMVLHRYEPTENLEDGNLQVMDLQQFLQDHPAEQLSDILNPDRTIKKAYFEKVEPYKLTLKTNSNQQKIVFLNNYPQNGIAHGVTPLKIADEAKAFRRIFERYTITPFQANKTLPADVSRVEE